MKKRKTIHENDWMDRKWRPMMGWLYIIVCAFDFLIAPFLWSILQAYYHGQVTTQWEPLTLKGAGLFHLAMGAVLGVTSYGRTREKMASFGIGVSVFGGIGVGTSVEEDETTEIKPTPPILGPVQRPVHGPKQSYPDK